MVFYKGGLSYETLYKMPLSKIVDHHRYAKNMNNEMQRSIDKK